MDGLKAIWEPYISSVTVNLLSGDETVATATTDVQGKFVFNDVQVSL